MGRFGVGASGIKGRDSREDLIGSNSLLSIQRPMNERMKELTEDEINKLCWENLSLLTEKIEEIQLGGMIAERLELRDGCDLRAKYVNSESPLRANQIHGDASMKSIESQTNRIWPWSDNRMHEELLARCKGQRLSKEASRFINGILRDHPNDFKHIQQCYKLSCSTMKRVQNFLGSRMSTNQEELKESRNDYQLSEDAKQLIIRYLSPPWKPRTIRAMQKHIKSELEESYSAQVVRRFVLKEMRYSYKKGWSRPHKYGTKRVQLLRFSTDLNS